MTFSMCVRESYSDEAGTEQLRFGVAVTTRLPAVGTLCPFVNEHGAIATQSRVNVDLGRRGINYLADGLAIDDVLPALLNVDDGRSERQLHGIDRGDTFLFSGDDCQPWFGHQAGENYTVAGNLLVGESVLTETADTYESQERSRPLADRLIDALAAGYAAGGDKRTDRRVQSAALVTASTEDRDHEPFYSDLRVDATETPIEDLRNTYELALDAWEKANERESDEE